MHEELTKIRDSGYTITLKLLQIMFAKGLVSRTDEGRYHLYKAEVGEEETKNSLLGKFGDATCRGSAMKMVMQDLPTIKNRKKN